MILADSSIWIDHLRAGDALLQSLLEKEQVVMRPFVSGEIALGSLRQRVKVLSALWKLPQVAVARDPELRVRIEKAMLFNLGIGDVDAHLLASAKLHDDARVWTRDKRLAAVAAKRVLAAAPPN